MSIEEGRLSVLSASIKTREGAWSQKLTAIVRNGYGSGRLRNQCGLREEEVSEQGNLQPPVNIPLKRAPGFEEPRMHGPGSGMTSGWAHFKEKAWAEGWKSQSSDYTVRYGNDKAGTWRKGKGLTGKKGRKEVGLVESEPTRRITKKQEREASTGEWRALQGEDVLTIKVREVTKAEFAKQLDADQIAMMSVLEKEVEKFKGKGCGKEAVGRSRVPLQPRPQPEPGMRMQLFLKKKGQRKGNTKTGPLPNGRKRKERLTGRERAWAGWKPVGTGGGGWKNSMKIIAGPTKASIDALASQRRM
ncbi:hypothetical protein BY996DRAFT_6449832 [Phakopsora pachyrhizi]|nr:hypothetical protein BY996DRAFT_6449832 [Phakopsora pachyrhizi]